MRDTVEVYSCGIFSLSESVSESREGKGRGEGGGGSCFDVLSLQHGYVLDSESRRNI